jgi:phage terminase small subunit
MSEIKPKQLTAKQEKFCREYLLTGNASEAYRRSYNAENQKMETINNSGYKLLQKPEIKARIAVLRDEIEEVLGINRITIARDLVKAKDRVLNQVKLKEKWNPELKQMEIEQDEKGNMIVEFDAGGLKGLIAELNKMLGYYSADKTQFVGKDGKPVDPVIQVEIIKPKKNE